VARFKDKVQYFTWYELVNRGMMGANRGTIYQDLDSIYNDDMLSLRNFYVNIITFWSSQGDLSSKKSKKTKDKGKTKSWHVWSKT